MGNKVVKSVVSAYVLFCFVTAGMAASDQKIPEWKDETNVPEPSRYESFEDGVPDHWQLIGEGSFSINPWHYKLGKQSLQWNFKAGDVIRINNTLGNTQFRGGWNNVCYASFGVWIYCKEPMPGKYIRFEFRENEDTKAYLDFSLNFKGWQSAFTRYDRTTTERGTPSFSQPVRGDINNILVKAPADTEGQVMIDALVYNGPTYTFINMLPNPEPWKPPALDETENPIPEKVSERDMQAIERVENSLVSPVIVKTEDEANLERYEQAMESVKRLNIVEDEHGIRGRPINMPRWHASGDRGMIEFFIENGIPEDKIEWFDRAVWRQYGTLKMISEAVTSGVTQEQYETLVEHGARVWKHLLDQGFNTSAGNAHYNAHTYRYVIRLAYLVRDALFKRGLMEEVNRYLQYDCMPFFAREAPALSMDYFGGIKTLVYGVFLSSDDPEKQLQALRFLSRRFSHEITVDSGPPGFKPDGGLAHVLGHTVDYGQRGLSGIAEIAYLFSNSSFELSDEAFERLKHAALRMYFYSNNLENPFNTQGAHVFRRVKWFGALPRILRHLALAGENGCDKELAQAYVNLQEVMHTYDPVFETEHGIRPSKPPTGNISMPYGALVAHRRADWLAVARGGGVDMRNFNHFGYSLGNASLSILGKDGLAASGTTRDGWDWNRLDGITAPYIPEITDIEYIHLGREKPSARAEGYDKAAEWIEQFRTTDADGIYRHIGNGGISWRGTNGSFRMVFANDSLFNGYRGIKSYFFIDDRIYALGSDITSYSKEYGIQTTLYQKTLPDPGSPTWINDEKVTGFPSTNHLPLTVNHSTYLIDSVGNGYFVPAGQNLFTTRKTQESRFSTHEKRTDTVGDFATAWIDHGMECRDAGYVYVIMPYCDLKNLATFSEDDYEILQHDGKAHILHDKIDGFHAGIFFKGGEVKTLPYVKEVERACQIMYRENNDALEIAVGDPAIHRHRDDTRWGRRYGGRSVLTPLRVTFKEAWTLAEPVDGVEIISTDEYSTVIEFACVHGKTFDFTLIKK